LIFGEFRFDKAIAKLHASGHYVMLDKSVEEDEHSLEMHLPFIYKVMEGYSLHHFTHSHFLSCLEWGTYVVWGYVRHKFGLVPIMVGHLRNESYIQYAKTLQPLLDDPQTFFIVSSDFCHWGKR
jgi:predicted class III extradiol MEMO1 family dioxygenase